MVSGIDLLTEQQISQKINIFSSKTYQSLTYNHLRIENFSSPPTPSAVLVPLQRIGDSWHILFTRRNAKMNEHAGQVAFPGGHKNPEDKTPTDTALREANEEIGLNPNAVNVLAVLPTVLTVTNYKITPIVGSIPYPYIFKPSPDEVEKVFTIPLKWLFDQNNFSIIQKKFPHNNYPLSVIYYEPYNGEVLWGASARIVQLLFMALTHNSNR